MVFFSGVVVGREVTKVLLITMEGLLSLLLSYRWVMQKLKGVLHKTPSPKAINNKHSLSIYRFISFKGTIAYEVIEKLAKAKLNVTYF